jgi:tetratricopeptide repeat protein 30
MSQAKIVWDREDYDQVENLFRRSSEFCGSNETWRLNLAHTLFMQEKYKESADCYAPIVNKKLGNVLL